MSTPTARTPAISRAVPRLPWRSGKLYWAVLAFLFGFSILLLVVSRYYLIPAFDAARTAGPTEKKQLAAVSALLLAVVLFVTVVGLLLVFRYGRFLLPRRHGSEPRPRTSYTDAWVESGRRLGQQPSDDSDDPVQP